MGTIYGAAASGYLQNCGVRDYETARLGGDPSVVTCLFAEKETNEARTSSRYALA